MWDMAEDIRGRKKACLRLLCKGEKESDIAERLGVSEDAVNKWKADADFKEAYDVYIKREIGYAAGRALKAEIDILDKGGKEALSAAKDIMDRGGFKIKPKAEASGAVGYVDDIPEDIL